MTMDLRHLRYFIAVAEEGHITRAAERLGMQQPPLSQRIKAIEKELDVQLLRRKARGIELTEAGRAFLENARATLLHLEHTFEATRRTARGEQGCISIGFTTSAAFHPLVPRLLRELRENLPLVSTILEEAGPFEIIERIGSDRVEIAFVRTPIANAEGLVINQLLEEPMVVAMPSEHVLAQGRGSGAAAISLKALVGETFIFYGHPHGALAWLREAIFAACHAAGFSPRIGQEAPHIVSTLPLVASGLGISIVPASLRRLNIDGVVYRHIRGPNQPMAPLNVASRRGDLSPAVRKVLKLAMQTAKKLCTDADNAR